MRRRLFAAVAMLVLLAATGRAGEAARFGPGNDVTIDLAEGHGTVMVDVRKKATLEVQFHAAWHNAIVVYRLGGDGTGELRDRLERTACSMNWTDGKPTPGPTAIELAPGHYWLTAWSKRGGPRWQQLTKVKPHETPPEVVFASIEKVFWDDGADDFGDDDYDDVIAKLLPR